MEISGTMRDIQYSTYDYFQNAIRNKFGCNKGPPIPRCPFCSMNWRHSPRPLSDKDPYYLVELQTNCCIQEAHSNRFPTQISPYMQNLLTLTVRKSE